MNIPLTAYVREFDELSMFFGYDYIVNDKIRIKHPKIREIVEFGESKYFDFVYTICAIPSDMKSTLWDMGIDYEEIDDFTLFVMLSKELSEECSKFIFNDLDISTFDLSFDIDTGEYVLLSADGTVVIDRLLYRVIVDYIRKVHGIVPKVEKSYNALTKKKLIELDRQKKLNNKKNKHPSILLPLIVSLTCTEECKHNSTTIQDAGLYEVFESIKQINKKKSACALLQGSYSGFVDTSKINKEAFNWMKNTD